MAHQQALTPPRTIPLPPWLPPHIRNRLAGQKISTLLPRQVRRRLRRPKRIGGAEWAVKYRNVTDGAHAGPWRHEYAPHATRIMDTFTRPWVREVWFCGVEQSGKTNAMLNCMGWCIDCDPGNIYYLMPTEDTAAKITGGKIKLMLQRSTRLARYLSRRQDDTTLARIQLAHGVTIFPAWANSPAAMASWPAKHCFGDEVDKYPRMTGKEADPITLIKKRNRTYKGRYKRFFSSTPGDGRFIVDGYRGCHQTWEYRHRCPHCQQTVRMESEHLQIPEGASPEQVERGQYAYHCPSCGTAWTEQDREQAIRAGDWHCTHGADNPRPATVGFHHRAWDCLDVPLAEIAAARHKADTGDTAAKTAWANGYEAIDYDPEHTDRDAHQILRLCDDRPDGTVPSWADALTISIDTQKHGFWYSIRAWEYGQHLQSALVRCGYVTSFSALDDLIYNSHYHDAAGSPHRIQVGIIDSQGSSEGGVSTAQVYDWCRRPGSIILPAKGASGRKQIPVTVGKLDQYPGTGKPIPGGLRLYHIDTHFHKDELARRLDITPGDPGTWWLHSGQTPSQQAAATKGGQSPAGHGLAQYAAQMCSEYRDERGRWQQVKKTPNHLWDCESNNLALAMYLKFQNRIKDNDQPPPQPTRSVIRSQYMQR